MELTIMVSSFLQEARKKAVQREVESLQSEGYRLVCSANLLGNVQSAKLRHYANGNVIIVTARNLTIELKKNGKIIKSYEITLHQS